MSDSPSTNRARARQAEQSTTGEDIRIGKIVVVGLIALAVFAAGIGWSYGLQSVWEENLRMGGPASVPTKLGQPEIGIVDQVPFDSDKRLERWNAENKKRLSSTGWVDRAKGVVHIPIEAAMQQVVASPPDIAGEGVPPTTRMPAAVKAGATGTAPAAPGAGSARPGGAP